MYPFGGRSAKEAETFRAEAQAALLKLQAFQEEMRGFQEETRAAIRRFENFRQDTIRIVEEMQGHLERAREEREASVREEVELQVGKAKGWLQSLVRRSVGDFQKQLEEQLTSQDRVMRDLMQGPSPKEEEVGFEFDMPERLQVADAAAGGKAEQQPALLAEKPPKDLSHSDCSEDEKHHRSDKQVLTLQEAPPAPQGKGSGGRGRRSASPSYERLRVSGPASCRNCHGTYLLAKGQTIQRMPFWRRAEEGGVEWLIYMDEERRWMVSKARAGNFEADYLLSEGFSEMPFGAGARWQCWDRFERDWAFDESIRLEPECCDGDASMASPRPAKVQKPAPEEEEKKQPLGVKVRSPDGTLLFEPPERLGSESPVGGNRRQRGNHRAPKTF